MSSLRGFKVGVAPLFVTRSLFGKTRGICPICHKKVSNSGGVFSFCKYCGAPIDWMFPMISETENYLRFTIDTPDSILPFLKRLRTCNGQSFTWQSIQINSSGNLLYAFQLFFEGQKSVLFVFEVDEGNESLYQPVGFKLIE